MSQLQVHSPLPVRGTRELEESHLLAGHGSLDAGPGPTLSRLAASLRRQALWVLLVTLVGLAIAAYLAFSSPIVFSAHAVLRLKDAKALLAGSLAENAGGMASRGTDPLLSQLQVLLSRGVARRVVEQTPLRLDPIGDPRRQFSRSLLSSVRIGSAEAAGDTIRLLFDSTGVSAQSGTAKDRRRYQDTIRLGEVSFVVSRQPAVPSASFAIVSEEVAVDRLLARLSASPRQKTDVIDLTYRSADPALAQMVVNATAREYQSLSAAIAKEESRRRREFLQAQLLEVDSMQRSAQAALSAFRSRERVYSSQEKFSTEQSNLSSVELRKAELSAQLAMYERLLEAVERGGPPAREALRTLVATPGAAANPAVVALADQVASLEARLDSLTSGPWSSAETNPDVRRLRAQRASTESRLMAALRSNFDLLRAQSRALDDLQARTVAQIEKLPQSEAEDLRLVQKMETVRRMAEELSAEYQKARVAEAVESGQVEIVDLAALPTQPVSADRRLKLLVGGLLALALAIGTGLAVDRVNTSIRSRGEIEANLRVPELATIPAIRSGKTKSGLARLAERHSARAQTPASEMLAAARSNDAAGEAYRSLRTNVLFSRGSNHLRALAITSSQPGEGKSTTAANLALAYAHQGMRVLLVDADMRRPTLHKFLGVVQAPGLSQVLLGMARVEEVTSKTAFDGLSILSSGTCPPNPAELLGGPAMRDLLLMLREKYDVVVVDTPPVLAAADAAVLSTMVDGTILVVRAGLTEREAAQAAVRQLTAVGAVIVGGVLNDPDSRLAGREGYGYYQGYYADVQA